VIVLDTHTLVWWASDPSKLSAPARRAIANHAGQGQLVVSSISAWEVALLVQRGRLLLTVDVNDWLFHVERFDAIRFIPIDNRLAVRSTSLPEPFHKDPADRIIVATAQQVGAPIVTSDRKIRDYPHAETIW
jgi:PIN domain nuclease of toxin-antitoxin system